MPKPYSSDLRERVAAACDEGEETREEVAARFGVSVRFVYDLLRVRRETGSVAPRPHAGGFSSSVGEEARGVLRDLLREQPDATLAELRDRLAGRCGVAVTAARVCQVLKELGLPREKSPTPPTSGTAPT